MEEAKGGGRGGRVNIITARVLHSQFQFTASVARRNLTFGAHEGGTAFDLWVKIRKSI